MADINETLRRDLRDAEFSEGYAESFLDTYVATQLKVLREQRNLTQKQLANKLHTSQGVISRMEDADYAAWNINTLKKSARAFEVRLHISFETYGSLIGDMKKFSRKSLERTPRSKDPILFGLETRKPRAELNPYQASLFDGVPRSAGETKTVITDMPAAGVSSLSLGEGQKRAAQEPRKPDYLSRVGQAPNQQAQNGSVNRIQPQNLKHARNRRYANER